MTPFEITTLLDIATLADMKSSRSYGAPIYPETLRFFAGEGLIDGRVDLDHPEMTERGRAYIGFLQAMPMPVANWTIPGPWTPSMPPNDKGAS